MFYKEPSMPKDHMLTAYYFQQIAHVALLDVLLLEYRANC